MNLFFLMQRSALLLSEKFRESQKCAYSYRWSAGPSKSAARFDRRLCCHPLIVSTTDASTWRDPGNWVVFDELSSLACAVLLLLPVLVDYHGMCTRPFRPRPNETETLDILSETGPRRDETETLQLPRSWPRRTCMVKTIKHHKYGSTELLSN